MKHTHNTLFATIVALFVAASSLGSTIKYDGPWKWNDLNVHTETSIGDSGYPITVKCTGTIEIAGYTDEVTELEIPKKITWRAEEWGSNILEYGDHILLSVVTYDYDVVAIAASAFNGNSYSRYQKLESVTIPNTVTKIKERAFYYCTSLKSISIPNSVTEIGQYCFYNCTALQSVSFSSQLTVIPDYCFFGCSSLTDAAIPNTIAEIGERAFGWTKISEVSLSAKCTSLGDYAFCDCINLKKVSIPNVKSIGTYCFSGATTNIEEIVLGDGVETIGGTAFDYQYHLRSLSLGSNITSIGSSAFYKSGSAPNAQQMSLVIPPSVKEIGSYAFAYMYNVTNLLVQGVPSINYDQFERMTNLVSLTIGPRVEEIESGFYYGFFYNLRTIVCASDDLKRIGGTAFYQGYSGTRYNKLEEVALPTQLESLGDDAFKYCATLKDIHVRDSSYALPKSLTTIGSCCFYQCTSLTNVVLEPGLSVLGEKMFYGCTKLPEVVIPQSIETIGASAFYNCSFLTNIVLQEGLPLLGEYMFYNAAIKEIFIPKSIKQIGKNSFQGCKKLSQVTLEDGLPLLGESMFYGCTAIQKISIPSSVEKIGSRAFYGCTGLTTANLSEGLVGIEESAFQGCVGLRAMSFPESLSVIGNTAFSGCTSLSTVSFPSGVDEVGVGAFSGCSVKSMLFNNANGDFLDQFSKESLRTLFLGKDADGITGGLLSDCSALETLMAATANPKYCTYGGVLYDKNKTTLIKYPCASSSSTCSVPATVTDVDESAFAFTSALTEIDFAGNIDTIGDSAFDWCLGLQKVTFGGTVNVIGDGAFTVCPSLESLYFKGDSPTWGDNQFWYSTPIVYAEKDTEGWDEAAATVGFVVSYIEGSETTVPNSWIEQYPDFLIAAGGDYEAAANSVGANGVTLRESYVAGLDPTDEESKFIAAIEIVDGEPVVTWTPDLSKDATPRSYTTYGKKTLDATEEWEIVTDANKASMRFFKVTVKMP